MRMRTAAKGLAGKGNGDGLVARHGIAARNDRSLGRCPVLALREPPQFT